MAALTLDLASSAASAASDQDNLDYVKAYWLGYRAFSTRPCRLASKSDEDEIWYRFGGWCVASCMHAALHARELQTLREEATRWGSMEAPELDDDCDHRRAQQLASLAAMRQIEARACAIPGTLGVSLLANRALVHSLLQIMIYLEDQCGILDQQTRIAVETTARAISWRLGGEMSHEHQVLATLSQLYWCWDLTPGAIAAGWIYRARVCVGESPCPSGPCDGMDELRRKGLLDEVHSSLERARLQLRIVDRLQEQFDR